MGRRPAAGGGLLLVDKPAGATSHDVVRGLRGALRSGKVGHTGTLDPFATGLLLALAGRYTRLAELFHALPKSYDATAELGRETATDDLTGPALFEADWRDCEPAAVEAAIAAQRGERSQLPPAYSAKRVAGERAYDMAREGRRPELEARKVVIHEIAVTGFDLPRVAFTARVSTGTYIRAIARDVGRALGCGAHLTELRRVAVGPFLVEEALAPEEAAEARAGVPGPPSGPAERWPVAPEKTAGARAHRLGAWRTGRAALPWLRSRELAAGEEAEIRHGRPVERGRVLPPEYDCALPGGEERELPVALLHEGELVAIAALRGERLFPEKVFSA